MKQFAGAGSPPVLPVLPVLLVPVLAGCICGQRDRPGAKARHVSTDDSVAAVVEGRGGQIYLVGASGERRCMVVKCDAAGKVLWHRWLEDSADRELRKTRCESAAAARGGGVVVVGKNQSREHPGLVVARYDPAGKLAWRRELRQGVSFLTTARVLARRGDYLVAASNQDAHLFYVITPAGEVRRRQRFDKHGFSIRDMLSSGPHEVTAVGRFYATRAGEGIGQEDVAIARFDLEAGTWSRRILGSKEAEFARALVAVGDRLYTAGRRVTRPGGEGAPTRDRLYVTASLKASATASGRGGEVVWEKLLGEHRESGGVGLARGAGDTLLVIANAIKRARPEHAGSGGRRILKAAFSTRLGQIFLLGYDGAVLRTEELDLGASTQLSAITRLASGEYCVVGKVRPREQLRRNRLIPHHRMLVLVVDARGKVQRKTVVASAQLQ